MRNQIFFAALGLALVVGAPAANAQPSSMDITQQPLVAVPTGAVETAQMIETVPIETVETVRTVRPAGNARRRSVSRRVVRRRTGNVVTTTTTRRTYIGERLVPMQAAIAPVHPQPLYDAAAPDITPPPVVAEPVAGTPVFVPAYRYVYEPDRILVIDPNTNIAVQSIPR